MSEQLPATIDRTKIIGDARACRTRIPLVLTSGPVSCLQPRRHRIHDLVRRQWVGAKNGDTAMKSTGSGYVSKSEVSGAVGKSPGMRPRRPDGPSRHPP
jgi:hypothetical protein